MTPPDGRPTVGLLGCGRMGSAMARALAAGGYEVVAWNRSPGPAAELAAAIGGRAVATPADVARAADVCVSMLADGAAVDAVYGGPDGLLAGAHPGSVFADASTVAPATLRAHAAAAAAAGAGLLDTPVSGSVGLAQSGTLTIMVGGDAADLARARPVLDTLAATVFHMGPLGTGAAMKLAVNTVIFGLNQAVAESVRLAEAAGIDRGGRVRRPRRQRRRGAVPRLQAGRLPRAGHDPGRVLARPGRQGPAAHRRPRGSGRRRAAAGRHEPRRDRIGRRVGRRRPRLLGRDAAHRRRKQRRTGLTDHLAGAGRPVDRAHAIVEAAQRRPQ